jgi:protein PhnA
MKALLRKPEKSALVTAIGEESQRAIEEINREKEMVKMTVTDSNGNELATGDSVRVIKDLKVKGSSIVLKQGKVIKNIRVSDDPDTIECKEGKSKLVLRTEFLKKA